MGKIKKTDMMWGMLLVVVSFAGCGSRQESDKEKALKMDGLTGMIRGEMFVLLEEYERACEDALYTEGKWKKINTGFSLYFDKGIGYCTEDINRERHGGTDHWVHAGLEIYSCHHPLL